MKKLESLETVERERESCILESKDAGLLSDFENGNNYNINKINNINSIEMKKMNRHGIAMCFRSD